MDKATIIIVICAAVTFVVAFLMFSGIIKNKKLLDKQTSNDNKEDKKDNAAGKQEIANDDSNVEELLAEITANNYMRDRAKANVENSEFTLDNVKETRKNLRSESKIHRIEAIEEDEHGAMDTDEIINSLGDEEVEKGQSVVEEFKNLSPKMKTIIITDALKRKDDNE